MGTDEPHSQIAVRTGNGRRHVRFAADRARCVNGGQICTVVRNRFRRPNDRRRPVSTKRVDRALSGDAASQTDHHGSVGLVQKRDHGLADAFDRHDKAIASFDRHGPISAVGSTHPAFETTQLYAFFVVAAIRQSKYSDASARLVCAAALVAQGF